MTRKSSMGIGLASKGVVGQGKLESLDGVIHDSPILDEREHFA